MEVTIKLNDNPQLIKIIKEIAKGFNEPIKIQKSKNTHSYLNEAEILEAVEEAKELKAAYLRGEIKAQSFEDFKAEMEKL